MAPVKTTPLGVTPQIMDDPKLSDLQKAFDEVKLLDDDLSHGEDETPVDVDHLVSIIEKYPKWVFEEQVSMILMLIVRSFGNEFTHYAVLAHIFAGRLE
jgi:hypothetical protein